PARDQRPHRVEPDRPRCRGHGQRHATERAPADARRLEPRGAGVRVLVTGAGGMLARAVVPALRRAGHAVSAFARAELDVTDTADVRRAIVGAGPDWVCHLAAYTDVDGCESREEQAMRVNGDGAGQVAAAAREARAAVLAISSDYVFAGDDPTPRRETDAVGPVSAYGRSKLAGEEAVRAANPCHLIVRTAWLYGRGGKNVVGTVRARALAGGALAVVDGRAATRARAAAL